MKLLTRTGHLIEEQRMSYLADIDADNLLRPLQAASCTYRIALGPRAGQKVLSLQTISRRGGPSTPAQSANARQRSDQRMTGTGRPSTDDCFRSDRSLAISST